MKWITQLRNIRDKIQKCIHQLSPEHKIAISDHGGLNYFKCKEIMEEVKKEDGDEKSLFGKYLSPRVQEWAEIVKEFEKGGVYLADAAQLLTRNVNYEIPALKQSLGKSKQVQQDCQKKEQESRSSVAKLKAKFLSSCQEMGIKGERVRDELQGLLSELPDIFQQTLDLLPSLSPAITFYKSTVHTSSSSDDQFLPMLHYVIENGNVTVYQWKYGTEPQVEIEPVVNEVNKTDTEVTIDWGDDLSLSAADATSGDPQTDDPSSSPADVIHWDVETDDIVLVEESSEVGVVLKEEGVVSEDTDSLMACHKTRALLVDDLMELREFLIWRLEELTTTDDIPGQFLMDDESLLSQQGPESVQKMLDTIELVLQPLNNPRAKHLLLIRTSPHYLDRMTISILSPQLLANKAQSQAEMLAARAEEAVATALIVQPQLKALISETRLLQRQVEGQISQLYKGREVNIIGEINVTLQQ